MKFLHHIFKKYLWVRNPNAVIWKFRRKRVELFKLLLSKYSSDEFILDVGGSKLFWKNVIDAQFKVFVADVEGRDGVDVICDGCALPFLDQSCIIFSNSVMEHVGGSPRQKQFADEMIRVGKAYYIQTPNKYFPIEPHTYFPFFQFLTQSLKKFVLDKFVRSVLWGGEIPKNRYYEFFNIHLLSFRILRNLFPDTEIWRERIFGMTKSFVVYKR